MAYVVLVLWMFIPTSVSWVTNWLKSPPKLLTSSPSIPFWNSIEGNSAASPDVLPPLSRNAL